MTEKLRYCIDAQVLQGDSRDRGIGRYSSDLARAIVKSGRVNPEILLNTALSNGFYQAKSWSQALVSDDQIHVFHGLGQIMGLLPENDRRRKHAAAMYDAFVRRLRPDCLHIGAPFDGMGDNTAIGGVASSVGIIRSATLYDLIPFQNPELHLADPRYLQWYNERLSRLREFDILFAISDYTRRVAVENFGFPVDRITNISSDASGLFKKLEMAPTARSKLLNKYRITRSFIVHTGILEARKNVKLLVEAYAALPVSVRQDMQLVLIAAATEAQREDISRHARHLGLQSGDIVFTGFVADEDLVKIYNLAKLLVMPSLSEGFGLPLLEAMRCGLPVLGANATSIPEVVGNKLYLFDPYDPADLAVKLKVLLTSDESYAAAKTHISHQQALFSWQKSADACLDAIEGLREQRGMAARGDKSVPQWFAQSNKGAHAPIAEINIVDSHLTSDQEVLMNVGPFVCSGPLAVDISCSAELRYRSAGYFALYQQRFSPRHTLQLKNMETVSGCLGVYAPEDVSSENLNLAYQKIQPLFDFMSGMTGMLEEGEAVELSLYAFNNLMPQGRGAKLFVDVSELSRRDSGTGIQRVVRNILQCLLTAPHVLRVEPVYRDGDHYRYARKFTSEFLGLKPLQMPDDYVFFSAGDTFLGLDLDALITDEAMARLSTEQCRGVKLAWVVYDILPVLKPEWFDVGLAGAVQKWVGQICKNADQLICISQSVADDVHEWLDSNVPERATPIHLAWWHLGANIDAIRPLGELDGTPNALSEIPDGVPVFLTVGTIEPRKGIEDLMDNAEILWKKGVNVVFVLAGRRGWAVDTLTRRIEQHPELGHRLFWFEGAPDAVLQQLYSRATAAILPSRGEGFGLPLVEAASYGTPIIARDLLVFREVGGDGAYYFSEGKMAESICAWLDLHERSIQPDPKAVKLLKWAESTDWLYDCVAARSPYLIWSPTKATP